MAEAGSTTFDLCAAGTFAAAAGNSACTAAPLGSFVAEAGSSAATQCLAGTYTDTAGNTACVDAPTGSFVAEVGSTTFTECAIGTYTDVEGSSECEDAPGGTYVDIVGSTAPTDCEVGTYTDTAGNSACFSCELYNPDGINRPFYYTVDTGRSTCDECACNGRRGTKFCEPGTGNCQCRGLFIGTRDGTAYGFDVDCADEQDISKSIALAYTFFGLFLIVCVPLLFHSGILASMSGAFRRDVAILASRMRLRTEAAIKMLARKKRSEDLQKLNEDLEARFFVLDEDGGGTIDRSELEIFLRVVQIQTTEAELDANIRVVDENDDGELDFDEFRHLISVLAQAEARRRLKTIRGKVFHHACARLIDAGRTRDLCQQLIPGLTDDDLRGEIGSHINFQGEVSAIV